jgi:hypothetical protein
MLGKLDCVRRRVDIRVILDDLYVVNQQDIQDLKNLSAILDPNQFKTSGEVFINPTFGLASFSVGGADADLIIDGLLIDVKVTKDFKFTLKYFRQLMGYYVLSVLNKKYEHGYDDAYDIDRIGIYFARHGYLHVLNLQDIVNADTFPTFLEWFETRTRYQQQAT